MPIILVELSLYEHIEQLQNAFKSNGPLIVNQLDKFKNNKNVNKIYLNQFINNKTKKLIMEANKLKKTHNIKYIWHNKTTS